MTRLVAARGIVTVDIVERAGLILAEQYQLAIPFHREPAAG
jgi:hypothetical protein